MSSETEKKKEEKTQTMSEYCQSLENWMSTVYVHQSCQLSAYLCAAQTFINYNNSLLNNNNISVNNNNEQNNASPLGARLPVRDFRAGAQQQYPDTLRIAPLWKRLAAEFVDFLVLLIVKVFVTLSLIDNFDLIDIDNIDLEVIQDSASIYDIASALTSELILLELTHRVVVCFFEAYCLAKNGCTPGKSIFRLRIIHCEAIQEVNNRLVITPGSLLSFPRALLRSTLKNFSIALLVPLWFNFQNNRTIYDHFSKSIVVSF